LLDHGANSSYRNILGLSALMAAIMHQKTSTALLLIKLGADFTVVDGVGNTPLHYACEANTLGVAKFLMENGHKVRVCNKYNETPVLEATRQRNTDMLRLLKEFDRKQYPQHYQSKGEKNDLMEAEE
jgi:ankyrin repeat protein